MDPNGPLNVLTEFDRAWADLMASLPPVNGEWYLSKFAPVDVGPDCCDEKPLTLSIEVTPLKEFET